ncbi:MAG: hypothetical protein KAU27_00225, partial [Desulfuromonadales bacterium]|nr:hypothetical protein [Desulfuromonadales bacterium]
ALPTELPGQGKGFVTKSAVYVKDKSGDRFFACFPLCFLLPRSITKFDQGDMKMKSQSWLFTGFYFWFGSFFGLPDRGEVC